MKKIVVTVLLSLHGLAVLYSMDNKHKRPLEAYCNDINESLTKKINIVNNQPVESTYRFARILTNTLRKAREKEGPAHKTFFVLFYHTCYEKYPSFENTSFKKVGDEFKRAMKLEEKGNKEECLCSLQNYDFENNLIDAIATTQWSNVDDASELFMAIETFLNNYPRYKDSLTQSWKEIK